MAALHRERVVRDAVRVAADDRPEVGVAGAAREGPRLTRGALGEMKLFAGRQGVLVGQTGGARDVLRTQVQLLGDSVDGLSRVRRVPNCLPVRNDRQLFAF